MTPEDVPALQELERAAGETFRPLGMDRIADDDPLPAAELLRFGRAGLAWVGEDVDGTPVAYLAAEVVDGALHVEQVTVHPRAARRGLGGELLEHAAGLARARGLAALTLTTFRDVPWNAPYYERLGFRAVPEPGLGPGLRAVRRHEASIGLDAWPRVVMRRPVQDSPS
jgi:GNAT superfamily N-acetyltransferase